MSRNKLIVLRIQSSEGTKRLEIEPSETTCRLFERVHDLFDLNSYGFALYREKNHKDEIHSSKSKTLRAAGLKHGDMLYLVPVNGANLFASTSSDASYSNNTPSGEPATTDPVPSTSRGDQPTRFTAGNPLVKEDDVDIQLWKLDGKIQRQRDDKLCRHNSNGCCVHCSPLEPYDENYLKQKEIKHLSFHAFLRKSMSGASGGKFVSGALTEAQCRIKPGCKDHPPWPRAICSKCQPSAITLNRQTYRHVDNVMFENPTIVEQFLNYWRVTGHQRIGFLYGNYEIYEDVPLGIRARVAAIYEPPQESSRDSIVLLPDEKETMVEQLAQQLGLRRVGWIFTDLIADDIQKGTVKCVRGGESHFLSAQECIMAAYFQNLHPNPCRFASNGYFGSKFVTVCVTGDKTNQVHMEGYAVSNQCMALVRDECLVPTKDAPELGFIKESSDKQYVPDVYYKEKDSYGNEVSRLARPLPVEYLLVDVPASTPLTPQYTFNFDPNKQPFPIENRMVDGHIQDFNALSQYLSQFSPDQFLQAMSDFHLLLYIATMDMLPMREYMGPLLAAVRERDEEKAREWAHSDHWATVEQLIAASNTSPNTSRPASIVTGSSSLSSFAAGLAGAAASAALAAGVQASNVASGSGALWTCPHCTFLNQPDLTTCDMCSLPR